MNKPMENDLSGITDTEEGFLQRWARRKQQNNQGELIDDEPVQEDQAPVTQSATELVEEPVLTDEDMPPIESLNEDSDYSPFMSPGVSDQLRNLALRRLFHIPVFNIRDGLDDYDGDYTSFVKLGNIVTADMKHMMEVEARKEAEKLLAEQQAQSESTRATEQTDELNDEHAPDLDIASTDDEDCCEEMDDVETLV